MKHLTKSLVGVIYWSCFTFTSGTELVANEYVLVLNPNDLQTVEAVGRKYNLTRKRKLLNDTFLFVKLDEPAEAEKGNFTWDIKSFKDELGNKLTSIEQQILRLFAEPQLKKAGPATGIDSGWSDMPDENGNIPYYAMGVEDAWKMGYEGNNVTVAIVDIGVELDHKDLKTNIDSKLCYNYVENNSDANPPDHTSYPDLVDIAHGSKCAGLVAALKNNQFCSAGVAPKSRIAAIRFISETGRSTDASLISVLGHKMTDIDIYSCSWASTHDPFALSQTAYQRTLLEGVEKGRTFKGSIFIFAAGNYVSGGNCNVDGYINTIYGITISSIGINGTKPYYDPVCACVLASTLGEGNTLLSFSMSTTGRKSSCVKDFHGTSASTAIASGIVALTLEANPSLTWRDVQHIVVETASSTGLEHSGKWMVNGVDKKVSPYFGFGLMNASAMVKKAKSWILVGPKRICKAKFSDEIEVQNISQGFMEATSSVWTNGCNCTDFHITILEHVQVNISIETGNISGIEIYLRSAMSGNQLASPLYTHTQSTSIQTTRRTISWVFNTVHFWGENPNGKWTILVKYNATESTKLLEAEMILHGTNTKFTSSEMCSRTAKTSYSDNIHAVEISTPTTGEAMSTSHNLPSNTNVNESHSLPIIIVIVIIVGIIIILIIGFIAACRSRILQCISSTTRRLRRLQLSEDLVKFSRLQEHDENNEGIA